MLARNRRGGGVPAGASGQSAAATDTVMVASPLLHVPSSEQSGGGRGGRGPGSADAAGRGASPDMATAAMKSHTFIVILIGFAVYQCVALVPAAGVRQRITVDRKLCPHGPTLAPSNVLLQTQR